MKTYLIERYLYRLYIEELFIRDNIRGNAICIEAGIKNNRVSFSQI